MAVRTTGPTFRLNDVSSNVAAKRFPVGAPARWRAVVGQPRQYATSRSQPTGCAIATTSRVRTHVASARKLPLKSISSDQALALTPVAFLFPLSCDVNKVVTQLWWPGEAACRRTVPSVRSFRHRRRGYHAWMDHPCSSKGRSASRVGSHDDHVRGEVSGPCGPLSRGRRRCWSRRADRKAAW